MLFYNIKKVNHFGKEVDKEKKKKIAILKLNDIIFYSYRVIQNINVKELSDPFPKEKKRINIIALMFSLALATKSAQCINVTLVVSSHSINNLIIVYNVKI